MRRIGSTKFTASRFRHSTGSRLTMRKLKWYFSHVWICGEWFIPIVLKNIITCEKKKRKKLDIKAAMKSFGFNSNIQHRNASLWRHDGCIELRLKTTSFFLSFKKFYFSSIRLTYNVLLVSEVGSVIHQSYITPRAQSPSPSYPSLHPFLSSAPQFVSYD